MLLSDRLFGSLDGVLLPTFAMNGVLHAGALCVAARTPISGPRTAGFILSAALLSVITLYVGILALPLFALLPSTERLYLVLGLCAALGAITYAALVRKFWIRSIAPRTILAIAAGCAVATLLAFSTKNLAHGHVGWWLTVCWWTAFSLGLRFSEHHAYVNVAPRLTGKTPK